jgi:GNAT superfamily N-acetyltransferase
VCIRAFRDLNRRQGTTSPPLTPAAFVPYFRHALRTDPDGFRVAVEGRRIVAVAIAVVRGRTHFLSIFFALPGTQSHGVGHALLGRAFGDPRPPRGHARCVVATTDLRAQALYLKFGMQPRTIVYHVTGRPPKDPPTTRIELRPVSPAGRPTRRALTLAARYDRVLREARRDADHRYFLGSKGTRMFEARWDGKRVGYITIRGAGIVGPGGVRDPSLSADLLAAAIGKARELGLKKISVWIPGLNEGALRSAFAAGLKVDFLSVWMAARDVGDLSSYIPANGALF